jgi:putative aldouronate transport system permease protein
MRNTKNEWWFRIMTLPGLIFLILFSYIPMFGIIVAFQRFIPARGIFGSPFIGLGNFEYMFELPDVAQVFFNTIFIAVFKILIGQIVPIIFALLLNEVTNIWFKKIVQTIVYLPHFLSWVILGTIFKQMLGLNGIVNYAIAQLGFAPIQFLGSGPWFRFIIIITDVWKGFGFGTIVYLSAILAISPALYEAAIIDGASRFQRVIHVTIPGMAPTIILMATLSLGGVLNAGFDQIFNMYNNLVYSHADIIDTFVYRIGLISMQYGLSTAVGLLKSVISSILIVTSYALAYKFANYRIF